MISLVRSGPEGLAMRISSEIHEIRHKLNAWGTQVTIPPEEALARKYGPTRRLVFLTIASDKKLIQETYVSETPLDLLLSTLITSGVAGGIEYAQMLPGFVMMRLMGDIERGINAIRRDLGGEIIDKDPFYRPDIPGTSTIIFFTDKSLAKVVPSEGIHRHALLIHSRSKGALVHYLSLHGIDYLGDAMGTPDWNDLEVRICDSDGFFELQRQRLLTVIQGMQTGVVLEERWEREQALTRRTIPVYMMRIYTPMNPQVIKELAMGMEYNADGNRFVDFDVFYGERKISAFSELEKNPGKTRNEIGIANRNEILKNLDIDSLNELLKIEEEIRKRLYNGTGNK